MAYKYEIDNKNYEDYASGRVVYNRQGTTAFPIRLASEIFLRCLNILQSDGLDGPYTIYDPCCGGGFMLTAIGFLHGAQIGRIYASDINKDAVALANRNLSLLLLPGINNRIEQINQMIRDYQKPSHKEALESALKLKERARYINFTANPNCFTADITNEIRGKVEHVNIIMTDLPYGDVVQWSNNQGQGKAVERMLNNLIPVLDNKSVIAIIAREKLIVKCENFRRVDHFKLGKRYVTFLRLLKSI